MMGGIFVVGVLSLIRIVTLTSERIALHSLGQARRGAMATMGIGFGGAAVVLWVMAFAQGSTVFINSTVWAGFIYAIAFAFYTAAIAKGPLSVVSPWSNATVILLWLIHPSENILSWAGICLFAAGAFLLTQRNLSTAVIWMLVSDILLASARFIDVRHTALSPIAYAASLFTVISIWMFIPIILLRKASSMVSLIRTQPGWSFIAASSNAAAYLTLFLLLRYLHPAAVEALSAFASGVGTLAGIYLFHESQGARKILSAAMMTLGTIFLLFGLPTPE